MKCKVTQNNNNYLIGKMEIEMKYEAEFLGKIIRQERNKLNWTQKKLGDKIGVTGKQISNYEHVELLPPLDVLERLCKEFNCELGYLLGEDDYSKGTKLQTIIYDLYGLTPASLQSIKNITSTARNCPNFGNESDKFRKIMNNLLTSGDFRYFMESLAYLDDCVTAKSRIWEQLKNELGNELWEKAWVYYNDKHVDYQHDIEFQENHPEEYEAIQKIEKTIDQMEDLSYSVKVARYELRESFETLIKGIYPTLA